MPEQEFDLGDNLTVYTPNPSGYSDASEMQLSLGSFAGRSVGSVLPPRSGLKGTIVPRSTFLGGSRNKGNMKASMVNIDPVPGEERIQVDISKLDDELIREALEGTEGENMRDIAFQAFCKLANKPDHRISREGQEMSRPPVNRVDLPNCTTVGRKHGDLHVERVKPAAFARQERKEPEVSEQQPQYAQSSSIAAAMTREAPAKRAPVARHVEQVQAPSMRATIELEGLGTIEVSYHNVVLGSDGLSLVLIYDTRYEHGMKYFPPVTDKPIFVDVRDWPELYKVQSVGLKYKVNSQEHCVLLVEKKAAKSEEYYLGEQNGEASSDRGWQDPEGTES